MDKKSILLVEDDLNLGFVVQDNLKMEGYLVDLCSDGQNGLKKFSEKEYDLCIFDVMLPMMDGFTLAKEVRSINQDVPIIFLTAKSLTEDKIKGFDAGGDDYLTKPFSNAEFLARVKALLRRSQSEKRSSDFTFGNFLFKSTTYELIGESSKTLTKKEGKILSVLLQNKESVVERELLLKQVWGENNYFLGRSLDVFITKLRKYLKEDTCIQIVNVHGVGFMISDQKND